MRPDVRSLVSKPPAISQHNLNPGPTSTASSSSISIFSARACGGAFPFYNILANASDQDNRETLSTLSDSSKLRAPNRVSSPNLDFTKSFVRDVTSLLKFSSSESTLLSPSDVLQRTLWLCKPIITGGKTSSGANQEVPSKKVPGRIKNPFRSCRAKFLDESRTLFKEVSGPTIPRVSLEGIH